MTNRLAARGSPRYEQDEEREALVAVERRRNLYGRNEDTIGRRTTVEQLMLAGATVYEIHENVNRQLAEKKRVEMNTIRSDMVYIRKAWRDVVDVAFEDVAGELIAMVMDAMRGLKQEADTAAEARDRIQAQRTIVANAARVAELHRKAAAGVQKKLQAARRPSVSVRAQFGPNTLSGDERAGERMIEGAAEVVDG